MEQPAGAVDPARPRGVAPGRRARTERELADWYEGVNAYLRLAFTHRANYARVDVDSPASLRALEPFCGAGTPYEWVPVNVNLRTPNRSRGVV